jgi:hypothetical protein
VDHPLDLEWEVVDEVDAVLARMSSPTPSPAAFLPARRTGPNCRIWPVQRRNRPRGLLRRGRERRVGGGQPIRLPCPESLCWRCGVPGHCRSACRAPAVLFCSRCGTMGLLSRDCPCLRPLAASLPRAAGPPSETPQRPRSELRARCAATTAAATAANSGPAAPGGPAERPDNIHQKGLSVILFFFRIQGLILDCSVLFDFFDPRVHVKFC